MNNQGEKKIGDGIRGFAAAVGVAAVAALGAATLMHVSVPSNATTVVAKAKPDPVPSYVAPTVPKMKLGPTENEPTPADAH